MSQSARPQIVSPRQVATLDAVRTMTGGGFDVDAWHVMNERDNALIADEVLHGPGSSSFVYSFPLQGNTVVGISVIGARHLANRYQGLRHRLVAAQQKTGSLFVFTSYPAENMPMSVSASVVRELEEEDDFYAAVVEVTDIKTGNSIQIERRELRFEERRGGGMFERPHYATIAQSKAYRNAVLALIPQDIAIRWRDEMLKLQRGETITAGVLDEKRGNVLRFAAQKAIGLDRHAIEALTLDQIAGLGDAAREGRLPAFVEAARALGLEVAQATEAARTPAPAAAAPAESANRRRAATVAPAQNTAAAAPNRPEELADRPREDVVSEQQPSEGAPPAQQTGQPAQQPAPGPNRGRRVNFEA